MGKLEDKNLNWNLATLTGTNSYTGLGSEGKGALSIGPNLIQGAR